MFCFNVLFQCSVSMFCFNVLFLTDNLGLPLVVVTLQAGNQNDTFELERVFAELCSLLEAVGLCLEGLFLNADKAFDVSSLWLACAWRQYAI